MRDLLIILAVGAILTVFGLTTDFSTRSIIAAGIFVTAVTLFFLHLKDRQELAAGRRSAQTLAGPAPESDD